MLPSTNTIILWFQGPPPATCTAIYDPVAGLEGEIGPLPAGDWTLLGVSPGATFNLSFTVGSSTIYHVDADAPGPVYDGSSWDQAFLTLQDALVTAHAGDSIWVAQGTYQPDQGGTASAGDREASFVLPDGVVVMGGYAGYGEPNEDARDPEGTPSILTGDLLGDDLFGLLMLDDNSYHVVTLSGGSATLDGFHIMSGQATGGYPHQFGGGLTLEFGDLVVKDCVLEMNRGNFGAAVANLGGSLQLVNTILMGNRATVLGGALYNQDGSTVLTNVRVVGNSAGASEYSGSAAIQNFGGTLSINNSTIVDNMGTQGRAIASFVWGLTTNAVQISNSIIRNGGDEVWSNQVPIINHSDVQGGAAGSGNMDADPLFLNPGGFSIEGEWIDGDYHVASGSPVIDAGDNSLVPADVLDLDNDGDVNELLPIDLDGMDRIQGAAVDMGAYEYENTGGGGGSTITFCVGSSCVLLTLDPNAPPSSNTYIGSAVLSLSLNFQAQLTAVATATSAAGGTWTAWLDPDIVGPGSGVTTTLWIKGENVDISMLPPGPGQQVAQVSIYAAPAP